jgi:hypothetical protein
MSIQNSSHSLDFRTLTTNIYTQLGALLKYKNMIDRLESIDPIKDLSDIKANWEELTRDYVSGSDIKILFDSLQQEINKTHDDYVRQLTGEKLAGMYALIQCEKEDTLKEYIDAPFVIVPEDKETAIGKFWDEEIIKEDYLYKITQAQIEIKYAQFDLSNNPGDAAIQSDIDELKQYISCCDAYVQFLSSQSDDDYDDISPSNITEFVGVVQRVSDTLAPIVIPAGAGVRTNILPVPSAAGAASRIPVPSAAVKRMNTPAAPKLSREQRQRAATARLATPRAGAGELNSSFSSDDGSTVYRPGGVGTKGKRTQLIPFRVGAPSGYGQTNSLLAKRRTQGSSKHLRRSTPEVTPAASGAGAAMNHLTAPGGGARKEEARARHAFQEKPVAQVSFGQ